MKPKPMRVAVLGAGAWGTTLAWMLAREGHKATLWARRPDFAAQLIMERVNQVYLPGIKLPDEIFFTGNLAEALLEVEQVIIAIPSHGVREVMQKACEYLKPRSLLICATKGLERSSGLRMSQVLTEVLMTKSPRLVALSGPNLSAEIAQGMPAISVAASMDEDAARLAQELLSNRLFRVYTNSDIIGVELCGAMKNVIALGAGISDGLGYGANAKAALITRGMAELTRLGLHIGARAPTFAGIAGIGDLMATCSSPLSRNWTVGYRLGQGEAPQDITASMQNVAEGVFTTAAALKQAQTVGVDTPITQGVYRVLYESSSPEIEVQILMGRRWRAEEEA